MIIVLFLFLRRWKLWCQKKRKYIFYEIDGKKYTVISKVVDNPKSTDKLYEILAKYALRRLNEME